MIWLLSRLLVRIFKFVEVTIYGIFRRAKCRDNSRVLELGCFVNSSRRSFSLTTEGRPQQGFSSILVSPPLNLLNQFEAVFRLTIFSPSTSQICSVTNLALYS